ncbi:MAG TPA: NADPH:quinone oxidoreductase family protein [Terriglobales bacterium]|nr:NADPH:quinone oxidoreductase family protein [Terriglobales bacterium]
MPTTMKAIVITRFGGPEVLEVKDVPQPVPGAGEVLVQVQAAGVNFADIMTAQRSYPGTPPAPLVAGREFAGTIAGSGERVMGYAQWGAFAEFIATRRELLWPQPMGWSPEEAAAFPVNYFTAYLAYWKASLLDEATADLRPRVLIHAAAGGVGTAAVEIGKILNLEMYGTSSSEEKLAKVKELGLQHGINYKQTDYEQAIKELTNGEGVDAVFEMLGGEHTAKGLRCLRDFGRVILYGTATGQQPKFDTASMYAKSSSVHGLWLSRLALKPEIMRSAWERLSKWIAEGNIRPVIGTVLPLARAAEAFRLMLERKNFGKIVLKI